MNKRTLEPEKRVLTTGIGLDGDTRALVDRLAADENRSRSFVVREAIKLYAKKETN
jgi:predicted transcriptional regulator